MTVIAQNNSFIHWCQNETANIGTSLPADGQLLGTIKRVILIVTIIIPLIALISYCLIGNAMESNERSIVQENTEQLLKKWAIVYMTLTGNPAHLGHLAPVAAAIQELAKRNIGVERVLVSLSSQDYLASKITPGKFALSHEARLHLLNGAIQEAAKRGMFQGVDVEFWNDQAGYENNKPYGCDHPVSYERLTNPQQLQAEVDAGRIRPLSKKPDEVYLVAGIDLCERMHNWPSVANAIVVNRTEEGAAPQAINPPPNPRNNTRIFLEAPYPELASLSSSKIQKGEMSLEPASLQEYFEAERAAASSPIPS